MVCLQKVERHRASHDPESNETDFHALLLSRLEPGNSMLNRELRWKSLAQARHGRVAEFDPELPVKQSEVQRQVV